MLGCALLAKLSSAIEGIAFTASILLLTCALFARALKFARSSSTTDSNMATAINRGASRSSQGAPTGTLARRRTATREGGSSGSSKRATMQYYTDDSPGFKLSPVVVIGMSLGFIFFVTVLHVIAKIRG